MVVLSSKNSLLHTNSHPVGIWQRVLAVTYEKIPWGKKEGKQSTGANFGRRPPNGSIRWHSRRRRNRGPYSPEYEGRSSWDVRTVPILSLPSSVSWTDAKLQRRQIYRMTEDLGNRVGLGG